MNGMSISNHEMNEETLLHFIQFTQKLFSLTKFLLLKYEIYLKDYNEARKLSFFCLDYNINVLIY